MPASRGRPSDQPRSIEGRRRDGPRHRADRWQPCVIVRNGDGLWSRAFAFTHGTAGRTQHHRRRRIPTTTLSNPPSAELLHHERLPVVRPYSRLAVNAPRSGPTNRPGNCLAPPPRQRPRDVDRPATNGTNDASRPSSEVPPTSPCSVSPHRLCPIANNERRRHATNF